MERKSRFCLSFLEQNKFGFRVKKCSVLSKNIKNQLTGNINEKQVINLNGTYLS